MVCPRPDCCADRPTRDCLTSPEWRGARNQVRQALEQNSIEKMVVLGPGSIFACTTEYTFWQYEMAFILAIFELGKLYQASDCNRNI